MYSGGRKLTAVGQNDGFQCIKIYMCTNSDVFEHFSNKCCYCKLIQSLKTYQSMPEVPLSMWMLT